MRSTRFSNLLALGAALSAGVALAQSAPRAPTMRGDGPPPAAKPFSITRVDPGLDAIVAPDAKAEPIASGFGLNEGPVWIPEGQSGYLLVGGLLDNVIYKISADHEVSVFMEQAGYTGTDVDHVGAQTRSGRSHVLLIGPSCASLDSQGRLIWCADNDRTVMRLEKDGTRTVLSAGANDGKRFSGPNDIVVTRDDAVYLTDNDFGLRDAGRSPDKQMPNGVWRIKDGRSTLVLDAATLGGIPNGIALSPDERYLYLTALQKMMRYEVKADGSLGAGILFTEGPGIGDGMKVDVHGNVYSTSGAGPGIIRITAPTGALLGYLNLPIYGGEPKRQICATNVAFGDADGKSLYITACDVVYRVRLKTSGVMPGVASAKDVHVMISSGFYRVYADLTPAFERASGYRLVTTRGPSMGDSPEAIPTRLARGESADVVILDGGVADELGERGVVRADSKVNLARSMIGMVVRAGAPKPDIGSTEALRSALLAATSIAYSDSGSGTYLAGTLFPQLGLWDQIEGKSRKVRGPPSGEPVAAVVARGESEIGFQQVSELIHVPGIDFVGPLPSELQPVIFFSGAITSTAKHPEAGAALLRFLASPEAAEVITNAGLAPLPGR